MQSVVARVRISPHLRRLESASALACLLAMLVAAPTLAATPETLVIEGVLTSTGGGAAADGTYAIDFALYNVPTGGTAAWTEAGVKVDVKGGQFSHVLGSVKPVTPALLAQLTKSWLGLKIGQDPELPRQQLHSVAFALRAAAADAVECSGCVKADQLAAASIGADKVSFTYAGAKTKGGPANSAIDLACTGCVSVSEMKFDADVVLGGNALSAKKVQATDIAATTVSATSFVGDGSKLTGIKTPAGSCTVKGQVVKGINADGSLQCVAAMDPTALPADGIDEISNGLIANQFLDETKIAAPVPIPDNNPTGVSSTIDFPDIGLAQKLDVWIDVTNSDISTLEIVVFDPNNAKYVLYSKGSKGTAIKATYPSANKPVSGDLTTWVNKNPKGKWRLLVVDTGYKNNTTDGQINGWGVKIQTLSNKKVQIQGNLIVNGAISGPGGLKVDNGLILGDTSAACDASTKGMMRWNNSLAVFEGCNGQIWTSINSDYGRTTARMGKTCKEIKAKDPTARDGFYYIDPDGGNASNAFLVYCDQTRDGGGWMLGVKHWYQATGMDANDYGDVRTAPFTVKDFPYKLTDAQIKSVIGPSNNFDVLWDAAGLNTGHSRRNAEYIILRNYTATWTWTSKVAASSTTTSVESWHRGGQLLWKGNMNCGSWGSRGINCNNIAGGSSPNGGKGCAVNLSSSGWTGTPVLYMHETNSDSYVYMCNGAQHTSSYHMSHRFWFRERK